MSDLFINQKLHSYITVSVKMSKYTKFHKEKEYKVTQLDVAFAVVRPIIVYALFPVRPVPSLSFTVDGRSNTPST